MESYMGVINIPDADGTSCNYVDHGYEITYGTQGSNLPNRVNALPASSLNLDFGTDTIFASDSTYILDALNPGAFYSWSTGETTQSITVTESGLYSVEVYNACNIITQSVYVEFPTVVDGIENITLPSDLFLYFNGNNLQLIQNNNAIQSFQVLFYDVTGAIIFSGNSIESLENFKASALPFGIYYYTLHVQLKNKSLDDGSIIYSGKIMIS